MAVNRYLKYLSKAFLYHWNLLAVGGASALAVISGRPDIVLPFVAAGEILFLAMLSNHPRFQRAIDAEDYKSRRTGKEGESAKQSQLILASLNFDDRRRYEKLKSLCIQLRRISRGVKAQPQSDTEVIEDLRRSGINRLLWIYLKLLYSKNALDRFFSTINEKEIEMDVKRSEKRLKDIGPIEEDTPGEIKRRKSLKDTLETSKGRLKNYDMAKENYEFIELELERLYSKIARLSEMSINRQDPDFITREVDQVSISVAQTERAMDELEFITGLTSSDDVPPSLLEEETSIIGQT